MNSIVNGLIEAGHKVKILAVNSEKYHIKEKDIPEAYRKKTGIDYALSTNSDLYLYNIEDGTTRNLTEGMMGYDTNPIFSPDGNYLAWTSMERDGYESDKNRLFILDMQSGEKTYLTENFDYIVNTFAWAPDASMIYFTSP